MKDSFSTYHPIINFMYFIVVIGFSMFFMHPIFLVISLICSMIYSIYLNRRKALKFNFVYMLPLLIILMLINPAFNHYGVTILLYVNDNPITLESIVYGVASATMYISVIMWFSCYNSIMTSDKFMYVFGKIIPALSLIISMALRFVPKFKAQIKVISNAQKCIGRDASQGNIIKRAKNGMKILSIMVTWALENSIETADSMKSRGYGLKGRTSFSNFRFDNRDKVAFSILSGLTLIVLIGAWLGENNIKYNPAIVYKKISIISIVVYVAYFLLLITPVILNIMEDIKWYYIKLEA
ncbi:energy-coupling factor transporter transmembrane component T [Hathewaya histolytica]|uniref:Cobalt transport protein n=1 Tax=Hathewaya histolytica TaxID=1498 RepID=A0A4U9RSA6_HATHI|nr:energy-coupling factor transporter transmembrane component T [Hathewaya histolytica]VTQ91850.1 cobalt transport protein [Hathewaya histolytica]